MLDLSGMLVPKALSNYKIYCAISFSMEKINEGAFRSTSKHIQMHILNCIDALMPCISVRYNLHHFFHN